MFQQKKLAVLVASALTLGLGVNVALAQTFTQGPSSSATPYMNNSAVPGMNTYVGNSATPTSSSPTASFTSILTVGDAAGNGYKMAGIPDGLGAFDNGNGTFTLLMNHEIGAGLGIARGPLTNGAFVSQWVIDKSTLSVVSGQNAITNLNTWNYTTQSFVSGGTTSFSRFCSSDLAAPTAFYNSNTGLGYNGGRIYMTGEESGTAGRATATVVSGANAGQLYQLPSLGRYSFENAVANPYMQNKTIVATTDDTSGTGNGKVYIYVGDKQATGNAIEQAGLQGGQKYVIAVNGSTQETRLGGVGSATTFTLAALPDQRTVTSNTNGQANTAGGTSFLRPEDIAWDPKSPNKMYFTTTDQFDQVKDGVGATVGRSRVWRMTFSDLSNPTLGGTVEMVVDGAGPGQMFDNLVVDKDGNLILQEDVGGQAHNGKVWKFDTTSFGRHRRHRHVHGCCRVRHGQEPLLPARCAGTLWYHRPGRAGRRRPVAADDPAGTGAVDLRPDGLGTRPHGFRGAPSQTKGRASVTAGLWQQTRADCAVNGAVRIFYCRPGDTDW